jgi:hypothetical protein
MRRRVMGQQRGRRAEATATQGTSCGRLGEPSLPAVADALFLLFFLNIFLARRGSL